MTRDEAGSEKSCGLQLFADGEPSNEWGLEELSTYAQMQYRQILDGEKLLAPAYWRLGHALVLAKEAFRHGKWTQHLKDLGIDKTRASRARAIYRTFDKDEDVSGLTVEEAYAKRQRKEPAKPDKSADGVARPKKDAQRLRKSVSSIGKRTGDVINDAAFAAPEEALILIPAVRKAIRQLQELLEYLEQQAGAAPADATAKKAKSGETPESAD
ncbi:MAG: hypothetical protein ACYTG0_13095 [Planctomycetota bacterium]|jgi:hypothetical protein